MKQSSYFVIFFLLGFALCFLLLKQCNKPEVINGALILKATHHESFQSDTTKPSKEYIKVPFPVAGPVREIPVPYYDSTACQSIRLYVDSAVDANLAIICKDSVLGKLLGRDIKYRLFVPLKITNTITKTDSVWLGVVDSSRHFFIGGEVGGNLKQFNLSVGVDMLTKKKSLVGVRYDFLQGTVNVSWKKEIRFKRPSLLKLK